MLISRKFDYPGDIDEALELVKNSAGLQVSFEEFRVPVVSYFMWNVALDSSGVLLPHSIISPT